MNPDILFGTTSSMWGGAGVGAKQTHDTPWAIKRIAEVGLQGIEFYGDGIEQYRANPMELQKLLDQAGISFIDVSNGEKGQSTNFIDPAEIPKTMADHVAFCRDFLQPLGCDHWKINMGQRPVGGPSERSEAQAPASATRFEDELGSQRPSPWACACRPIPHIWGPMERGVATCAGCSITPIPNMSG